MPTIADVARQAGVSRTAVSFAFNDPSRLSSETLNRILGVAHELGYYPNPVARSLISKRVGVLGMVIPQSTSSLFANPFYAELLRGVGQVCDQQDFALLLVPPAQGSLTRAFSRAAVDGFVVIGLDDRHPAMEMLRRRRVPFVTVDGPPLAEAPSVNIDDRGGACQAAQHLLDLGHRDLLTIAIRPPDGERTDDQVPFDGVSAVRLAGYRDAFERANVPYPARVIPTASTREAGQQAFHAVWEAGARPSAVLAMSDIIALGVLDAARDLGIRVPEDLSVVGFDDIPAARLCRPALTTVFQPTVEKGMRAAQMLIDRHAGDEAIAHHTLPTQLIVRESTVAR